MLKALKYKAVTLLMFLGLALSLCGAGWLAVLLYVHGSSAAFEVATGLIFFALYWAFWGTILIIRLRQGGAK